MLLNNKLLSDGMVIQRGEEFIVSGSASKDYNNKEITTASFAGKIGRIKQAGDTVDISFTELPVGGPYTLEICANGELLYKINDILVGDVFLMSGQSNMELDIGWVYHSFAYEIDEFDSDFVRQFKVPLTYDFVEESEVISTGEWVKAKGEYKKTFGAIGFFMAKKLLGTRGVPIGLIQTAVPGCPIESFLAKETVEKYQKIDLDNICFDQIAMAEKVNSQNLNWDNRVEQLFEQAAYHLQESESEKRDWKRLYVPFLWEMDEKHQSGVITLEREFYIDEVPSRKAIVELGLLIETDITSINGIPIGSSPYQYVRRRYDIPFHALHKGKNTINIRLCVTDGVGRLWEELPCHITLDDSIVDLKGVWRYALDGFTAEAFPKKVFFEYLPYGVYNAMILPCIRSNMKYAGVLWYQGESNTGAPEKYIDKFNDLVMQIRKETNCPDLPFYTVQIAGYEDPADPTGEGWESIRKQQEMALQISNCYMVKSLEFGSKTDLHPQNKKALGDAIANMILS